MLMASHCQWMCCVDAHESLGNLETPRCGFQGHPHNLVYVNEVVKGYLPCMLDKHIAKLTCSASASVLMLCVCFSDNV